MVVADALAECIPCRYALGSGDVPGEGSPAQRELEGAGSLTPAVNRLISVLDLWVLVATDQVHGLSMLIRDGSTVFSLFPLLRSVLEHSTAVVWIFGATDTRGRAARANLLALRGMAEIIPAASHLAGKGSSTHVDARDALREMRSKVDGEFGTLVADPLSLEGESPPRPTELAMNFGREWGDETHWEGAYDYLCATANHPTLSAAAYFEQTDPKGRGPEISPELLDRLVRTALVPYLKALQYYVAYLGLPDDPLNAFIDRVNAAMIEDVLT